MDGTNRGMPSPQTGNIPPSQSSIGSEQESKVTGQRNHRDITPTSGENLVARATTMAGKDGQLSRRSVSSKKYTPDEMAEMGYKVEESRKAIAAFIIENDLNKREPELKCELYDGYKESTRVLFVEMKRLLDAHFSNVNQMYQVLQSDYRAYGKLESTARRAARSRRVSEEEQNLLKDLVILGNSDKRHKEYWQEKKRIHLYASFCGIRFFAALKVIPKLDAIRGSETFRQRIEDFLPQSIECMKMYQEVIQCQLGLEQYSKLEESLIALDRAAFGAAMLADLAMDDYMPTDGKDKLRQMLATHSCCFIQWLTDFDPEQPQVVKLCSWRVKHLINAAILADNPKQAERFLQFFRKQMEANNPDFAPQDVFSLCHSLIVSLAYLYDRPEPLAYFKARLEGTVVLLTELVTLIRTINKKKMLTDDLWAALVYLFERINNDYQLVIKDLHEREAGVVQIASDLIREEEEEQKQIKEKLEARAKKRREKEEQRQEAQWQKKQAIQAAAAEKKPEPPEPKPYDLESTLNEAAEAFARKEPIGVLNNIFKKVIHHSRVSGFDKAQAHYSYADMVTSRLRRQLKSVHKMIEPVYAYSEALENQGPPELEKDIKFREALKQFKLNMQQISINTLIMNKAVKEAQEIFFSLNEDQPEFVDALVDLHNDMEYLVAEGKAVIQCCRDIPDIYARRGQMIQHYKLSKKIGSQRRSELRSDSERHRELADHIKDLEELGKNLDTSMGMLAKTLTCEQAAQVRQTLSIAKTNTPTPDEKTSPTSTEDKQQTLNPDDPGPAPGRSDDSAQGSLSDPATSSMATLPVASAEFSKDFNETDMEAPLVTGIEEPQEVLLPLKLPIPENMMVALGISILEHKLIAPMKLYDSESFQEKNLTAAKSRKGKKGKRQGRREKGPTEPQPQATAVKEENADPGELGLKIQTRLCDYLEVLNETGKTPDGKAVPEKLDLKALLARVQQGTFLKDSWYFGVDFTFLSDALNIPIQANLPMSNKLYFRPGLVRPEELDLCTNPEPHLRLEYSTYSEGEHQWFASMEHYFQCGFEEDYQLFTKQPVKQAKPEKAGDKSKKGP
ncbi:hypothetical protein [Endozoicomonas sp. 8E]|uniref:hypothetical protein n=1 Tax=Endozoicomonas sp. 8E TaxID=3035692 RepID=UPI0029394A36|nr:hypothetical protein [Endozoicomonas sp. 8E]WOG28802.1 hypothetical protein P6910_03850 [Endozoicomonas sp. 8E]